MQLQLHTSSQPLLHTGAQRQQLKRLAVCATSASNALPRTFAATAQDLRTLHLTAREATPEKFAPFGQVKHLDGASVQALTKASLLTPADMFQLIGPTGDGKGFDDTDASLKLDLGTPRYRTPLGMLVVLSNT